MGADVKEMKERARLAHDAVADLEEPFKTEAFKIFLARSVDEMRLKGHESQPAVRSKASTKGKAGGTKKKAKRASLPESTLRLDVGELKKLGTYCTRFGLQGAGTEQIAFILANFVREHTDLEYITAGDIAHLHRQLISQRVRVAPVNNPADWTRALNWLTAPSRRKEWLEKRGDGFVVSNSGLLQWHELEEQAKARLAAANAAK